MGIKCSAAQIHSSSLISIFIVQNISMGKRFTFFILLFFYLWASTAHAQQDTKAAKKIFDQAIAVLDTSQYANQEGIRLLESSIKKDSQFIIAYQVLFQVQFQLKQYQKAIEYFNRAYRIDSNAFEPYWVKYATAHVALGQYLLANSILDRLLSKPQMPAYLLTSAQSLKQICAFAIAQKNDSAIVVKNVGDSINTDAEEYFPTVTVQDSLFLFMRRDNWKREDFFSSIIRPNGFTKAITLSDTLNFADKKGSPSLSSDLQTLYYAADYAERGFGRYDIYKVNKTKSGWSIPINLGRTINTDFWESAPSISPDGQAIYFCSNLPGGYGGIDIYVSYKNEKGSWDEAINLGPFINTAGDEQTPYIHSDNRSLYFASNGWPGFGGSDLFVSRKKINGNWSKPMNLGYPINTFDNEGSIAVASNGAEGYIASDRPDSRGGLDIYKVVLAPATRANKVFYFNGTIADAITKKPLAGKVNLVNPLDQESIMHINVDSNGVFVLALPYFDSLGIQVNSPDHDYASLLLNADSLHQLSGSTFPFYLTAIEKQFSKNFRHVYFDVNTATLQKKSFIELDALVNYLQSSPDATIMIEGHTDNTGTAQRNMQLSTQRAEAIAQFLISNGIHKKRIQTKGYGATKPVASNFSEEGRAQNRRTSFTISIP